MRIRKHIWLLSVLVCSFLFAGCGISGVVTVDVGQRRVEEEVSFYYNEESADELELMLGEDISGLPKVTLNGKSYFVETERTTIEEEALLENGIILDEDKFILYMNQTSVDTTEAGDVGFDFFEITYQFDREIVYTNGTIGTDGRSVVFTEKNMADGKFYAIFSKKVKSAKKISFSGVKNKKTYKKSKYVWVESKGIITDILVNGKSSVGKVYYERKGQVGILYCDYVELTEDGKYKVTAILASGAKKSITVTIDKTKPKTNIKNNKVYQGEVKITFSDKTSGMKKAVLNGKRIKSGKVIKKAGDYTLVLTDKAGNKRKVSFQIEK